MTRLWDGITALCILAATASAQGKPEDFMLDPSRPYVYLAFDHVGRREPAAPGELPQGLWLRLVNNCKIPIEVQTFDLGTIDGGVGLNYEVVTVAGIVDSPAPTTKPRGYSSHVGSPMVIDPGGTLLFSIPRDHVSKWWYLQTRFDLGLPVPRSGVHPFSTVSFFWETSR